jgi:hypothetical protein
MINFMERLIITGFWMVAVFLVPMTFVYAGEYSVRPFLVDIVAQPRDVVTETVLLTNDSTSRKYVVYATVNEVSLDTSDEIKKFVSPVMTDRSNTVTSWIEVTRGRIEIPPGEQKEVTLTLRINPQAEPGEYQAYVGFVPAPNRPAAEKIAMNDEADGVVVKITIADERKDSMKISAFKISRFITSENSRGIDVAVENMGDIASAPTGEIIFYDSRGVEVDSAPFNTDGIEVPPGKTVTIKGIVPVEDSLGRFKANISLQYGGNQRAALFDTTNFYLIPFNLLLMIFGGIFIGAISVAFMFKRAFLSGDEEDDSDGDSIMMYVREGHDPNPQDHDIDLKNTNKE